MLNILLAAIIYILAFGIPSWVSGIVLSPTQLVKIHLQNTKGEKRLGYFLGQIWKKGGISAFFVGANLFAVRQAISSAAFGLAEFIYTLAMRYFGLEGHGLLQAITRALNGALMETLFTYKLEIKDLFKKKSLLLVCTESEVFHIVIAILIRNFIFWSAYTFSDEIVAMRGIAYGPLNYYLPLLFSLVASLISNPIDGYISYRYGEYGKDPLRANLVLQLLLPGLLMRMVQYAGFNCVTAFSGHLARVLS